MRCPVCGHDEDRVLDTRAVRDGRAIRRRRECLSCQRRFTTYEYVESGLFQVVKKDGRREPFQRQKLIQGLSKACEKRPIAATAIEDTADRIEARLARTGKSEVQSRDIGARVLEALRHLDPVAYVRFASVYLNFSDIRQFLETIHELPGGGTGGSDPTGSDPTGADPAGSDPAGSDPSGSDRAEQGGDLDPETGGAERQQESPE